MYSEYSRLQPFLPLLFVFERGERLDLVVLKIHCTQAPMVGGTFAKYLKTSYLTIQYIYFKIFPSNLHDGNSLFFSFFFVEIYSCTVSTAVNNDPVKALRELAAKRRTNYFL